MNSVVPLKRFYKAVSVKDAVDGWQILLDGRPLKTPARAPLIVGPRDLADAIAGEWDAQQDKIRPESMPLFRLLATAIDRVAARRDEVIAATVKYAETDLLCYWADEPQELIDLQAQHWQPVLDWARDDLGAEFRVTAGIRPVDQSPGTLGELRRAVAAFDDFGLTGLSALAGVTGSLVLALALAHARIDAQQGGVLALLDEEFQSDRWGADAEAQGRRDRLRAEIVDTVRFLNLIG
jgi:chaperone required for assembly of F1-ATPase